MKKTNAVASTLAAGTAAFVGSEMLEAARRSRDERLYLAAMCLASFFGLWACWEVLQVRQSLGLTPEK